MTHASAAYAQAHVILEWLYLLLPPAALLLAAVRARRRGDSAKPLWRLVATAVSGLVIGAAVGIIYAVAAGAGRAGGVLLHLDAAGSQGV